MKSPYNKITYYLELFAESANILLYLATDYILYCRQKIYINIYRKTSIVVDKSFYLYIKEKFPDIELTNQLLIVFKDDIDHIRKQLYDRYKIRAYFLLTYERDDILVLRFKSIEDKTLFLLSR